MENKEKAQNKKEEKTQKQTTETKEQTETKKQNSEENKNTKKTETSETPKETELEKLKKELDEYKDKYLRTLAEFDNFRKRKEKESLETRDYAIISFVESILPSIENFEMSLKMKDNANMFIKGVEMIHKNLIDTLKEHHIESFEPQIGHTFDPYSHDPIAIEDKSAEPGKVLGVVSKGYKFKEKTIKPAKVKLKKEN